MKYTLLLFSFFMIPLVGNAQYVEMPDSNFKKLILRSYDSNNDGELSFAEADKIISISLNEGSKIGDVTGIEQFHNVRSIFIWETDITNFKIDSIPLLRSLVLSQNKSLHTVEIGDYPEMVDLAISGSPLIHTINTFDLSKFPKLYTFEMQNAEVINFTYSDSLINMRLNHTVNGDLDLDLYPNLRWLRITNTEVKNLEGHPSLETYLNINPKGESLTIPSVPNLEIMQVSGDGNHTLKNVIFDHSPKLNSVLIMDAPALEPIDFSNIPRLRTLSIYNCEQDSINLDQFDYLGNLYLDSNNFTDIDISSRDSLTTLSMKDNKLKENINIYGASLIQVNIEGNPLLKYAKIEGDLHRIIIDIDSTLKYLCVKDEHYEDVSRDLSPRFPDLYITSGCPYGFNENLARLEGQISFDESGADCATGTSVPYRKIKITEPQNTFNTTTNSEGNYYAFLDTNAYDVSVTDFNSDYFIVDPETAEVNIEAPDTTAVQDFCLTANNDFSDVEVLLFNEHDAIAGFDLPFEIKIINKGNKGLEDGIVTVEFPGDVSQFESASIDPLSIENNKVTWKLEKLEPIHSTAIKFRLELNNPMDSIPLESGDILDFHISLLPEDDDNSNNDMDLSLEVVSSYDPNDITCLQGNIVHPQEIGEYLHYRIRFENTGTADAINIEIRDTIPRTMYDINTYEVLSASHNVYVQQDGDVLHFMFDDINLPYEEGENDGYVIYKIKSRKSLKKGSSVQNRAGIFFDFNWPIITNYEITLYDETVSTTRKQLLSDAFNIFPNPVSGSLYLENKNGYRGHAEIHSVDGNRIGQYVLTGSQRQELDVRQLATGIYVLSAITESHGVQRMKLMVE